MMGSTTFRTRASLCLCRLLLVGLLGLALWPLNLFAQEVGQASQDQRPNVLVLFADDMTYEALGSLELIDIETPNLDRLAARGTTFTRAYNRGSWSGAVCIASRTMLMTGRYVWSANAIHASTDEERKAIQSKIAELQALVDAPKKQTVRSGFYAWDGERLMADHYVSAHSEAFAALVASIDSVGGGRHVAAILTQICAARGAA